MTPRPSVAILDYSVGNTASLCHAFYAVGCKPVITNDPTQLSTSDILVLPGVGSFNPARKLMISLNLDNVIYHRHSNNQAIIGICLGMQLLTLGSDELVYTEGLGILSGTCRSFSSHQSHIGWNSLSSPHESSNSNLYNSGSFFFNHSFRLEGNVSSETLATCHHAGDTFPAIVRLAKTYGIQFHPEKSQSQGIQLLHQLVLDLT